MSAVNSRTYLEMRVKIASTPEAKAFWEQQLANFNDEKARKENEESEKNGVIGESREQT